MAHRKGSLKLLKGHSIKHLTNDGLHCLHCGVVPLLRRINLQDASAHMKSPHLSRVLTTELSGNHANSCNHENSFSEMRRFDYDINLLHLLLLSRQRES